MNVNHEKNDEKNRHYDEKSLATSCMLQHDSRLNKPVCDCYSQVLLGQIMVIDDDKKYQPHEHTKCLHCWIQWRWVSLSGQIVFVRIFIRLSLISTMVTNHSPIGINCESLFCKLTQAAWFSWWKIQSVIHLLTQWMKTFPLFIFACVVITVDLSRILIAFFSICMNTIEKEWHKSEYSMVIYTTPWRHFLWTRYQWHRRIRICIKSPCIIK